MTETATREDLEERLKDSPGCETVQGPCTEPVAWARVSHCCKRRQLLCDMHKRKNETVCREILLNSPTGAVRCYGCGTRHSNMPAYIPV